MVNMKKIGLGIILPAAMLFTACNRFPVSTSVTFDVIQSSMPAFYNITLNATHEDMKKAGFDYGDIVNIKVSKGDYKKEYNVAYVTNYNEVGSFNKSLCDYEAVGRPLNISPGLDNKDFEPELFKGGKCTITLKEKQGYTRTRSIAQVTTKLSYEECGRNNSKYANARDVCQIGLIGDHIKSGVLYRGSSPFNKSKNPERYDVADKIMNYFNINSEISVSVDPAKLEGIMDQVPLNYSRRLYTTRDSDYKFRRFFNENLGSDFFDTNPGKGGEMISNIFKYMGRRIYCYEKEKEVNVDAPDKPVFYIHCDEGKDRTGFLIMVLEALSGVDYEDLVSDFMETFLNYYNISKINNPEKYYTMAGLTCYRMLYSILMPVDKSNGETRIDKLSKIDFYNFNAQAECEKIIKEKGESYLAESAENYMKEVMKDDEEGEFESETPLTVTEYITYITNYLTAQHPNNH